MAKKQKDYCVSSDAKKFRVEITGKMAYNLEMLQTQRKQNGFSAGRKEGERYGIPVSYTHLSGFYGVVIDITDDDVIVEFGNNKNCRIPMRKTAITEVEKPETAVVEEKTEKKK